MNLKGKKKRKMKEGRKFLAFFLTVCMMATFVPAAFAEDPQITDVSVYVSGDGGSAAAWGNHVDVTADPEGTITVKTDEDSKQDTDSVGIPASVTSVTVNVEKNQFCILYQPWTVLSPASNVWIQ